MPSPATNPRTADGPRARRYRTVFVDWSKLGPSLSQQAASDTPPTPPRPIITTVDDQLDPLRKNVKDAAKAVLTWLAQAVDHGEDVNLDDVLDACLRPGPDSSRVNFNALTEQINATLGTDFTAKRIRTAVRHLRQARRQAALLCRGQGRSDQEHQNEDGRTRKRRHGVNPSDQRPPDRP